MKISYSVSLSLLWAVLTLTNFSSARAETFSVDFLAAETADDDDGSFGPWTIGGYDTTNATFGAFTSYGSAQHLDNWGSLLPANGNNGPFFAGEFKGYGYDTSLAVPAVVINTTNVPLSPCCGISSYAPGEVFMHSWFNADPDPVRHSQVIRYTAADSGFLTINAMFTQKHTGNIPWSVILDGVTVDTNTLTGQNSVAAISNLGLTVNAGSVLDFALAGGASASFDATITLGPIPTDNAWAADRSGDWNTAGNWFPTAVPNSSAAVATFGPVTTGSTTVFTNTAVTVKQINFNNTNSYFVAGGGSVNLQADAGNAAINAAQGTHEFQARVNLLSNTGADVAAGATIEFNNRLSLGGNTLTKTGAGTILINNDLSTGGGSILVLNGTVGGGGSIAGSLTNTSGRVAPGISAGKLTVQGSYSQAASGVLAIELGGASAGQFDVLQVNQTAALGGTLAISLANGFQPQTGNLFEVISTGSLSGVFSGVTGGNLGGGLLLNPISTSTSLSLLAAMPGDTDLNKIVAFNDLNNLLTNYGLSGFSGVGQWNAGDFNDDHAVTFDDLNTLLTNYGQQAPLSINVAPVPEPSTLALAAFSTLGLLIAARRREQTSASRNACV